MKGEHWQRRGHGPGRDQVDSGASGLCPLADGPRSITERVRAAASHEEQSLQGQVRGAWPRKTEVQPWPRFGWGCQNGSDSERRF